MSEEDSIDAEADKFEKDGFFASNLGDSVLTAIANVIGMQIVVFTAQESCPVIHISPRGKSRLVKWCMFHFMLMVVGTMMLSSMRL